MSWFGQSPPLPTEFHLLRWHCRIPIGNSLLYCPHNHPMKYSFFVSKYLSRNRTDNNVSENGFRTQHMHSRSHMHMCMVQCPLCLLRLEDFKGVFLLKPTSWGSCTVLWPSNGSPTRANDSFCVRSEPQPKAALQVVEWTQQKDSLLAKVCAFWTNTNIKVRHNLPLAV